MYIKVSSTKIACYLQALHSLGEFERSKADLSKAHRLAPNDDAINEMLSILEKYVCFQSINKHVSDMQNVITACAVQVFLLWMRTWEVELDCSMQ